MLGIRFAATALVLTVVGCSGASATPSVVYMTPAPTVEPSPSPTRAPTPSPTPTATPAPSVDAELAEAIADADASIDQIVRLYKPKADAALFSLLAQIATTERASLATRPPRITNQNAFLQLDLLMELVQTSKILEDRATLADTVAQLGELRASIDALANG